MTFQKGKTGSFEISPYLKKIRTNPVAKNGIGSYFETELGDNLYYRTWKSVNQSKIIIGVHGMAAHSEYYVLIADQLINSGVSIYALDLKHHGLSSGKKGDLKSFNEINLQLNEFIKMVKSKNENIQIYLMGISMGGVIAINYSVEFPESIDGLILMAPGVKTEFKLSFLDILKLPIYLIIYLVNKSKLIINIAERAAVGTRNPLRLDYQNNDELRISKVSLRYILNLNSYKKKAFKNAANVQHPLIIFQGTEDKLVSYEGVKSFFEKLPIKDKTFIELEGAYHSLYSDPSMIKEGWQELREWISSH
ncbi:MAG: alpha/beta fold hydrolase [Candidatus Lokiarchaeota archaeon]|nr:alpha/beta fold hydrolase [Candidatus Lokiarchaeota archaeon]